MSFIINLTLTNTLGKEHEWAWRIPIIAMQLYPVSLLLLVFRLPETPRWYILHDQRDNARESISAVFGEDQADDTLKQLAEAHEREEKDEMPGYADMVRPSGS